jgi:hypothetical protein
VLSKVKEPGDAAGCAAHHVDGYSRYLPVDFVRFLTDSAEMEAWVAEIE